MREQAEIARQRRTVERILRENQDELVERWLEKIRLLTREKGPEGMQAERMLAQDAPDFVQVLLARLADTGSEGDLPAFYQLVMESRRHHVRLADVAYVLLELKSVSKQLIFEKLKDELEAFRVSRIADDAIEAVLRKGADLYEVSAEADNQVARDRLQEVFAAWELEEVLARAETRSEVCRSAAEKMKASWDLTGWSVRLCDGSAGPGGDISGGCVVPLPLVREQRQRLTEQEVQAGGVLSVLDSVIRRREGLVLPDVLVGETVVNGPELARAGVCSMACWPLPARGGVMGALLLCGRNVGTFQARDGRRLKDFAGVLALALDRAGHVERSRKEISEAEVIARIGRSLLELPTREELLQSVAEALRAFRDYFDVSLFRVDEESGDCVLMAEAGRERRYRPEGYTQDAGQGFIGLCARTGQTVRASDLAHDARRLIAFEEERRARSELAVPVTRGEKVLGVMHFLSERGADFPDSEVAALEHVAPHIGVALQNARMIVQRRHDQFEIEQAHRQLAAIIRSAAVGITSLDVRGVYTHWSPSCESLLGYSAREVVGKMTPADFAAEPYDLQALLAQCLRDGRTMVERAMRRKDGAVRILRETRVRMDDEEGRHVGFTAYVVDITDQKRAEAQLRRERDTLSVVVGAMGAGLALFDRDLALQWANPTMMQWFGLGPDSIGRECHEVCTGDYCEGGSCPLELAVSTGRPQTRVHELTDARGVWHCYQQVFTPVTHGDTRLMTLTFDITDQRRQTDQMRLINKLTQKIETSLDLEKVLHLVLTCVTAGHAIGLNRASVFLLDESRQRLEGRMAVGPVSADDAYRIWADLTARRQSIEELLDSTYPSDSDRLLTERVRRVSISLSDRRDTLVSTLESRTSAHVGDARSDPDINRRLADELGLEEFVCVPLAALDEPLGVMLADNVYSRAPIGQEQVELLEMFSRQASMAIANARAYQRIRDQLEELSRTRDRLIEAERMASVGRMASHLAHEIRNPLTAIGGFAASIARQYQDDARTQRNATIIYDEARRLERTLANVLDYTRPLRPNKRPVDLNEIVRQTLEQFQPQLKESDISPRLLLEESLPLVPADAEMVKQVVINLVKNAVEALEGRQRPVLTVATLMGEVEVEMVVADNGVGMEQDTLNNLFSPFFTTKMGGIGLGLSVSRRIVAQHGGRIEVESTLGVGSAFTVTLSLSDQPGRADRADVSMKAGT